MSEVKIINTQLTKCPRCKVVQTSEQFFRIIARDDYSPGCDDDHIKLFAKPTLTCSTCRNHINQKNKLKLKQKIV